MSSFVFGAVNSSDYGVYVSTKKTHNRASRDITFTSVPGKNGDFAFDQGRFGNVTVTYQCFIFGNFHEKYNAFVAALYAESNYGRYTTALYKKLTDNTDDEHFRLAVFAADLSPEVSDTRIGGSFDVSFICMPQRWLNGGTEAVKVNPAQGTTITNPTLYTARPIIKISTIGKAEFSINTYKMIVNDAETDMIIDCEKRRAYYTDGTGLDSKVTIDGGYNDFPEIAGGIEATIKAVDATSAENITKMAVQPMWWTI